MEPATGCGRPTHFIPNTLDPKNPTKLPDLFSVSDANGNDYKIFYNYGVDNSISTTNIKYGVNSFPLDNLHQYFITVYFINQKIMELNYYIKQGKLKFALTNGTWKESDLLPLYMFIVIENPPLPMLVQWVLILLVMLVVTY